MLQQITLELLKVISCFLQAKSYIHITRRQLYIFASIEGTGMGDEATMDNSEGFGTASLRNYRSVRGLPPNPRAWVFTVPAPTGMCCRKTSCLLQKRSQVADAVMDEDSPGERAVSE